MKFSFLLHLMLIVLELIPFKFDDLSTQIWWILFKILNSLMCAIANFHLKVRLLWNFHRIYQDVQLYYLFPFPFHTLWFFFFFFWVWMILIYVADCIALLLTTSIFLHELLVDFDYHNWVLWYSSPYGIHHYVHFLFHHQHILGHAHCTDFYFRGTASVFQIVPSTRDVALFLVFPLFSTLCR